MVPSIEQARNDVCAMSISSDTDSKTIFVRADLFEATRSLQLMIADKNEYKGMVVIVAAVKEVPCTIVHQMTRETYKMVDTPVWNEAKSRMTVLPFN